MRREAGDGQGVKGVGPRRAIVAAADGSQPYAPYSKLHSCRAPPQGVRPSCICCCFRRDQTTTATATATATMPRFVFACRLAALPAHARARLKQVRESDGPAWFRWGNNGSGGVSVGVNVPCCRRRRQFSRVHTHTHANTGHGVTAAVAAAEDAEDVCVCVQRALTGPMGWG